MAESAGTPLDSERYISLETFKRDGTGVPTPVGFGVAGEEVHAKAP